MDNRKIFIGTGKKKEFSNGGSIINASICIDDLLQHVNEFQTVSNGNGKKYLRLNIGSRKEADNYGNTHYIQIDTWKPEPQQGGNFQTNQPQASQPAPQQNFDDEEIPF